MIDFPFTPYPNDLYEIQKKRSPEEKVILQVITRFTYGFQRKICRLSLDELEKQTNLTRKTLKKHLKKLDEDKFIIINANKIGGKIISTEYQINEQLFINKEKIYGVESPPLIGVESPPHSPSNPSIYKETRKKGTFLLGKDNAFAEARPTQRALTNEEELERIEREFNCATYARSAN